MLFDMTVYTNNVTNKATRTLRAGQEFTEEVESMKELRTFEFCCRDILLHIQLIAQLSAQRQLAMLPGGMV